MWDVATGAELVTLSGHTNRVSRCAYSPDGTRIVSASGDHTLKVWDAAIGAELVTLRGHADWSRGLRLQPRRHLDRLRRRQRLDGVGRGHRRRAGDVCPARW